MIYTDEDKKSIRNSRVIFVVILVLAIAAAVVAIGALGIFAEEYLEWDSTLAEFRTNAEAERLAFKEEMAQLRQSEEEKIVILSTQKEELLADVEAARSTLAALALEIDRNAELTAENGELSLTKSALSDSVSSLKSEQSSLQEIIAYLTGDNQAREERNKTLENDYAALKAALNETEGAKISLDTQVDALNTSKNMLESQIVAAEELLSGIEEVFSKHIRECIKTE